MIKTYSIYIETGPGSFVVYCTKVDDGNLILDGALSPEEYAAAKIILSVYQKHGGWPLDFAFYDEYNGVEASVGIFGNLGGPKEVPSPTYMTKEQAIFEYNQLLECEESDIPSVQEIMEKANSFEDKLIADIKRRIDTRNDLLSKMKTTWKISTNDVIVRHGTDKFNINALC